MGAENRNEYITQKKEKWTEKEKGERAVGDDIKGANISKALGGVEITDVKALISLTLADNRLFVQSQKENLKIE